MEAEMKVVAFCNLCIRDHPGAVSLNDGELITVTAGTFIDWKYRNGHQAKYWMSAPFYELLLAHGVHTLAERGTRAAVLNFYSCWETFVSYVIRMLVEEAGNASSLVPKDHGLAERRIGVFAGLYFERTRQWPPTAGPSAASLRNKVIHDDTIPSEGEVSTLADAVQKAIIGCKAGLGDELFRSQAEGEKAHGRFERDLLAAGIEDAEAANVTAMYEGGSLTQVDVNEFVRWIRAGEPLEDPSEH
jgi:hypothetical protein